MKNISRFLFCCLIFVTTGVFAQEKAPADSIWGDISKVGEGVQRIKYDEKGRVKTFIVIGEARISKALPIAKAKTLARQNARLKAKAEVVKFLREKVSSVEQFEEETIIQLKGFNGKGNESEFNEEGKTTERTTTKISSTADGLIRGMTTLVSEVCPAEEDGSQVFRLILGWSAKNNEAAAQVRKAMAAPLTEKKGEVKKESQGKKNSSSIPAERVVSPDAGEFL